MGVVLLEDDIQDIDIGLDYSWKVLNGVTKELSYSWKINGSVTREAPYSWRIGEMIESELAYSWRIYRTVSREIGYSWRIKSAGLVGSDGIVVYEFKFKDRIKEFFKGD